MPDAAAPTAEAEAAFQKRVSWPLVTFDMIGRPLHKGSADEVCTQSYCSWLASTICGWLDVLMHTSLCFISIELNLSLNGKLCMKMKMIRLF